MFQPPMTKKFLETLSFPFLEVFDTSVFILKHSEIQYEEFHINKLRILLLQSNDDYFYGTVRYVPGTVVFIRRLYVSSSISLYY